MAKEHIANYNLPPKDTAVGPWLKRSQELTQIINYICSLPVEPATQPEAMVVSTDSSGDTAEFEPTAEPTIVDELGIDMSDSKIKALDAIWTKTFHSTPEYLESSALFATYGFDKIANAHLIEAGETLTTEQLDATFHDLQNFHNLLNAVKRTISNFGPQNVEEICRYCLEHKTTEAHIQYMLHFILNIHSNPSFKAMKLIVKYFMDSSPEGGVGREEAGISS
jgi:hypothetical protein